MQVRWHNRRLPHILNITKILNIAFYTQPFQMQKELICVIVDIMCYYLL